MNTKELKLLQFIRDQIIEGILFTDIKKEFQDFNLNLVLKELNTWISTGGLN